MHVRRPGSTASEWLTAPVRAVALAAIALALTVGCSSPSSSSTAAAKSTATSTSTPAAATPCGTTRTAANVPVHIQIEHGQVSCATALTVERAYAAAILAGKAPGAGGGGPVHVDGWICQGFTTPVVLQTGQASKCVQGGAEILAILPAPA